MLTSPWDAWTRLLNSSLRMVGTGVQLAEAVHASGEVIDSRCRVIASAAIDPGSGDYHELGRMIPEKIDALGKAGQSALGDLMAIQYAALDNCRQIAGVVLGARALSVAEMSVLLARSLGMMERALDSGGRALAPIHQRVTSNARRLRKGSPRG